LDDIFKNKNMNRLYEIFKTPSGQSAGKALLNHTIFSPSQTGETVPLKLMLLVLSLRAHMYVLISLHIVIILSTIGNVTASREKHLFLRYH
jgi:hypothetical protein